MAAGLKPWEAYRCTLYELRQMLIVRQKVAQDEFNAQITLEHMNASLNSWAFSSHPERMPSVNKLLHKTDEEVATTHDEVKKLLQAAGLPGPR